MTSSDSLAKFFERGVEISSFDIQRYTPIRGKLSGEVYEHRAGQVPQMYSRVHFCPHSITHMDLPWCLDAKEMDEASSFGYTEPSITNPNEMEYLLEYYSKIRLFNTIILDLSEKAKIMKNSYIDDRTGHINSSMDETAFGKMMQFLEIRRDEDILSLASEEELHEKFLIIKTGWDDAFNIWSTNLDNPYFELRHPYLVYPFFPLETIKWLVEDVNVKGIGCETPGMDNPAYYTTPHFAPTYSKRYLYYDLQPKFRPTSILLLTNFRYYVKHLTNFSVLESNGHFTNRKCVGKLCIIPISLGLRDANLAKTIFAKGE